MRRARPDTMNTYMKNLQKGEGEREREKGGGVEEENDNKLTNTGDSCLRLSVKSFF